LRLGKSNLTKEAQGTLLKSSVSSYSGIYAKALETSSPLLQSHLICIGTGKYHRLYSGI